MHEYPLREDTPLYRTCVHEDTPRNAPHTPARDYPRPCGSSQSGAGPSGMMCFGLSSSWVV
jgi:hypothetical protein